ncbi:MAG TPA: DUF4129 domain-containing protein [Verrucomicrobiota bacterium]|nr:DUF4129 domain-containing protein [Verrucomicrobiota bacterium]HNU52040.1 DUF4129 domain-containing protein [Verrucomicrobiota bacterium]
MNPNPPIDDAVVRDTVERVLARPEFHGFSDAPWFLELIQRLKEWAQTLGRWAQANPVEGWILFSFLLLVGLALLAHLLYVALGDALPGRRSANAAARKSSWHVLEGTAASWQEALARAREALAAGNVRRAVWIAHRVLLGLMDEQGSLRFAAGKTNADYLGECDPGHPWCGLLERLTAVYEQVIYAHRPPMPETLTALVAQVETCRTSALLESQPPTQSTA